MRNPTAEELESVNNYLKSISVSVEEGLKPCPFCGSNKVEIVENTDCDTTDSSYYVRCNNCGATTKYFYVCFYCELDDCYNCEKDNCLPPEAIQEAKLHAIRAWNRRANARPLQTQ